MKPRFRGFATSIALLAFSLTAAALDGDPTDDPCTLATRADVEQVIGRLKSAPASSHFERVRTCEYEFANATQGFSLWLFPASGIDRARRDLSPRSPVPGLGEEAFVHHNTRSGNTELYVKQGNATLMFSAPEAHDAPSKLQALARKALPRLKGR
jgi:hypothetical protein